MKIDSSSVSMLGSSSKLQSTTISRQLVAAKPGKKTSFVQNLVDQRNLTVSEQSKQFLATMQQYSPQAVQEVQSGFNYPDDDMVSLQFKLLFRMLETFSGRRMTSEDMDQWMSKLKKLHAPIQNPTPIILTAPRNALPMASLIEKTEYYEKETMSFSMSAQVKTADGKSIDVSLDLNMSREFYESRQISTNVFKDPLVVNFNAPSAALSSNKFSFDIDCDGASDQISQLMSGSGFLSVDWNSDGKINDGSELFGALSGDGFADLAKFDKDGNGWIDESDNIFDKLRVWAKDENGKDRLFALGELGIGAIFLGNVDTQYALMDGSNTNGMIRSTGFFLREDGTAGTMQHVDLVV